MGKRVNLPLFADPHAPRDDTGKARKKPSVDTARARLGGRLTADDTPLPGLTPGVIVLLPRGVDQDDVAIPSMPGVVLFSSRSEIHVLLDAIRLRRLHPAGVEVHDASSDIALEKLASDARMFGQLQEGQTVRYADDAGDLVYGKVVEKCRWGALVLRDDGSIIAVGFRKLWPAAGSGEA